MSIASSCPCCDSTAITFMPASLSQFVVWRTTGVRPQSNQSTLLAKCESCNYYFCNKRFTNQEMNNLYQGYRNNIYNSMRLACEPAYNSTLYSDSYVKSRKQFINNIIANYISEIDSVLDYGGDDGRYIPDVSKKLVYDLSDADPIDQVRKFDTSSSDKFDLVMNCQVLEHVSDINGLIETIKKFSNKYVYIEVPAYRRPPPINVVIGEHINFFRKSSLHKLLNKHDIKIIDTQIDYDLQVLGVLGKL